MKLSIKDLRNSNNKNLKVIIEKVVVSCLIIEDFLLKEVKA